MLKAIEGLDWYVQFKQHGQKEPINAFLTLVSHILHNVLTKGQMQLNKHRFHNETENLAPVPDTMVFQIFGTYRKISM